MAVAQAEESINMKRQAHRTDYTAHPCRLVVAGAAAVEGQVEECSVSTLDTYLMSKVRPMIYHNFQSLPFRMLFYCQRKVRNSYPRATKVEFYSDCTLKVCIVVTLMNSTIL